MLEVLRSQDWKSIGRIIGCRDQIITVLGVQDRRITIAVVNARIDVTRQQRFDTAVAGWSPKRLAIAGQAGAALEGNCAEKIEPRIVIGSRNRKAPGDMVARDRDRWSLTRQKRDG